MKRQIPNQFHFALARGQEAEPFHLVHYLCLESCLQVNRPEAIFFYCHNEPHGQYWDRIRTKLTVVRVDAAELDGIARKRMSAAGGVCAPLDSLFVNPLPAHLFEKTYVTGSDGEKSCDALLMSAPGVIPAPDNTHVEPPASFCHFGSAGKGLLALLEDDRPIPDTAYSIHLRTHLWWDQRNTEHSLCHGGRMTARFIHEVDTSYNRAARRFLPPDWESEGSSPMRRAGDAWNEIAADAKAIAGSVAIPLIRMVKPDFGHLNLAHSHRAWRRAQPRFHPRNPIESAILRCVIQWDEYGIFHERLRAEDVVIDIGGHIGAFVFACHDLGSRNIHSYEAFPSNFEALNRHVGDLPGVHLYKCAVFRSDRPAHHLRHSGPIYANTGGGSVLFDGTVADLETQQVQTGAGAAGQTAEVSTVIALDEILEPLERVKLMKIDCEGSEFPILLTSSLLRKVERMVGEYHEVSEELMERLNPDARLEGYRSYRRTDLESKLKAEGFAVTMTATSEYLGAFEAVRRP